MSVRLLGSMFVLTIVFMGLAIWCHREQWTFSESLFLDTGSSLAVVWLTFIYFEKRMEQSRHRRLVAAFRSTVAVPIHDYFELLDREMSGLSDPLDLLKLTHEFETQDCNPAVVSDAARGVLYSIYAQTRTGRKLQRIQEHFRVIAPYFLELDLKLAELLLRTSDLAQELAEVTLDNTSTAQERVAVRLLTLQSMLQRTLYCLPRQPDPV